MIAWSVLILLLSSSALADHQPEMTEFSDTVYYTGNGQSGSSFHDYNLKTSFEVPDSTPEQQWIEVDWSEYNTDHPVNGVLFYTDPTRMTSGLVKFYVDGVLCTDTSGVGVNG